VTLTDTPSTPTLYHGTDRRFAQRLLAHGWAPHQAPAGANQGRTDRLYVTTTPDNAAWYAGRHADGVVLRVDVPADARLAVDPEDGMGATVDAELHLPHGLPGNLTIATPLPAHAFAPTEPKDHS
jgi:hypothetical protein